MLCAGAAGANQPDLNDVGNRLIGQTGGIAHFIGVMVFLIGVIMTITGLWKFYKNVQNPNDPSAGKNVAMVYIFAGALMVALPAVMGSGVATFFGGNQVESTTKAKGGLKGFKDFN